MIADIGLYYPLAIRKEIRWSTFTSGSVHIYVTGGNRVSTWGARPQDYSWLYFLLHLRVAKLNRMSSIRRGQETPHVPLLWSEITSYLSPNSALGHLRIPPMRLR